MANGVKSLFDRIDYHFRAFQLNVMAGSCHHDLSPAL